VGYENTRSGPLPLDPALRAASQSGMVTDHKAQKRSPFARVCAHSALRIQPLQKPFMQAQTLRPKPIQRATAARSQAPPDSLHIRSQPSREAPKSRQTATPLRAAQKAAFVAPPRRGSAHGCIARVPTCEQFAAPCPGAYGPPHHTSSLRAPVCRPPPSRFDLRGHGRLVLPTETTAAEGAFDWIKRRVGKGAQARTVRQPCLSWQLYSPGPPRPKPRPLCATRIWAVSQGTLALAGVERDLHAVMDRNLGHTPRSPHQIFSASTVDGHAIGAVSCSLTTIFFIQRRAAHDPSTALSRW